MKQLRLSMSFTTGQHEEQLKSTEQILDELHETNIPNSHERKYKINIQWLINTIQLYHGPTITEEFHENTTTSTTRNEWMW